MVSIGAADRLSGRYLVTWCRHRFDDDGYATEIRCTGQHNRALFGLLTLQPERSLGGVYPAIVTDLSDPDDLGRVRVTFPWLSDEYESAWARVVQVGAGPDRGLHWYPEVEDEVMVAFVAGRPEAPVVLGGLYNGADKPPFPSFVDGASGQVTHRGFTTRAGHRLELIDKSGQEGVVLVAEGDITIEAKGGSLTLKGKTINLN